jgi:DNA-binding MarR family transcriptional regulator
MPLASANLKQLLLARNDWFAQEIMKGVKSSDYAFITPAQSRLLAHMGGRPMSMAEIARRLAISRQAVHKTVNELARRGVLEIRDDPERGNSKLVSYTQRGKELNRGGARIIEEIEQRLVRRLGAQQVAKLKAMLAADWDDVQPAP